ncbi:uncharacterized protein LOC122376161 isoform X3 [Amphibalanus amphitrite]|uniref:uncharacterized protein LOC122376161 isoform X3 n=1 Tax=Amphibalanus amphitrite TaxID=1232801 RepID=UPI001C90E21E|nr:uncharacterized protein LOC122376161 isoform X3 [Amphibalanus amphitrite]
MEKLLAGLQNVFVFLDDVLVSGCDEVELLKTVEEVLRRFQDAGVKPMSWIPGAERQPSGLAAPWCWSALWLRRRLACRYAAGHCPGLARRRRGGGAACVPCRRRRAGGLCSAARGPPSRVSRPRR